ncbi:MAG: HAD-IB family phosphatase [Pseudomonadota bacterium]
MPQYPAVSVFDVDNTLIVGSLWQHTVKQVLLEAPSRVPRYMVERGITAISQMVWRRNDNVPEQPKTALRLVSRVDPESRNYIIDYVVDSLVREALRPGAVDTLIQRRKAGDRIFFVSDCFDFCLAKFAARLGGADIIATRTFENSDGSLALNSGEKPCVGLEKLARLKDHFDGERRPPFIRAYGHDQADYALLSWADAGTAVNPDAKSIGQAQAMGLSVVDWSVGINDASVHRPAVPGAPKRSTPQETGQKSSNQ